MSCGARAICGMYSTDDGRPTEMYSRFSPHRKSTLRDVIIKNGVNA